MLKLFIAIAATHAVCQDAKDKTYCQTNAWPYACTYKKMRCDCPEHCSQQDQNASHTCEWYKEKGCSHSDCADDASCAALQPYAWACMNGSGGLCPATCAHACQGNSDAKCFKTCDEWKAGTAGSTTTPAPTAGPTTTLRSGTTSTKIIPPGTTVNIPSTSTTISTKIIQTTSTKNVQTTSTQTTTTQTISTKNVQTTTTVKVPTSAVDTTTSASGVCADNANCDTSTAYEYSCINVEGVAANCPKSCAIHCSGNNNPQCFKSCDEWQAYGRPTTPAPIYTGTGSTTATSPETGTPKSSGLVRAYKSYFDSMGAYNNKPYATYMGYDQGSDVIIIELDSSYTNYSFLKTHCDYYCNGVKYTQIPSTDGFCDPFLNKPVCPKELYGRDFTVGFFGLTWNASEKDVLTVFDVTTDQQRDSNIVIEDFCKNNPYEFKKYQGVTTDSTVPVDRSTKKVVAVYWDDWGVYKAVGGKGYFANNIPVESVTHILYSFIPVCGKGLNGEPQLALCTVNDCCHVDEQSRNSPLWNLHQHVCAYEDSDMEVGFFDPWSAFAKEGSWGYGKQCGEIFRFYEIKKQNPDIKILPSIGGWTLSKMFYRLGDESKMKKFIDSVARFVTTWDVFDGVDIDWEHPGGGGADVPTKVKAPTISKDNWGINQTDAGVQCIYQDVVEEGDLANDPTTYNNMMKNLRTALDGIRPGLQLTSAVNIGVDKISRNDYGEVADTLDHMFLMSYDLMGAWGEPGHQTNLYHYEDDCEMNSIDRSVDLILKQGFPNEKLVVGVAMYGRGWLNVKGSKAKEPRDWTLGSTASGAAYGYIEDGVQEQAFIAGASCNNRTEYLDPCTYGALAICHNTPTNIKSGDKGDSYYTWDTPETVAEKGRYVHSKNLGGLFAWVIDNDNGEILNAMATAMNDKNPAPPTTLRCNRADMQTGWTTNCGKP